jgi:hypothetical protein
LMVHSHPGIRAIGRRRSENRLRLPLPSRG